ncbi:MAG TPA: hypothetical protein VEC99_12050, partial [Clostridia bacterium]|nr:hypothetical protein [Clostridia bacterium]
TNSLVLNNYRDVWGRNWQDWTYRSNAMDIQGNFLTQPNPYHPNNTIWNPSRDAGRLASFMTTPPDAAVGIGIALYTAQLDISAVTNPIPVRLSSFTTNTVTVNYSLEAPGQTLEQGKLEFAPGDTVRFVTLTKPVKVNSALVRLRLHDPEHGEVTGIPAAWFIRGGSDNAGTILVPSGATWKYLDNGTNAGTAWREPGFDDSSWPSGPAELGYGDQKDGRPENTVINSGPDQSKHVTYYFRHTFVVDDPARFGGLTVKLKRDDGGIVYLNGTNVFSSNMPVGPVDFKTEADLANDDGTVFYTTNALSSLLVAGTNTIAVEIHQESVTSSDLSFDLQLEANPGLALQASRFGQDWLLHWTDPTAILEQADDLVGPWTPVVAPSPAPMEPIGARKFYRLRKP